MQYLLIGAIFIQLVSAHGVQCLLSDNYSDVYSDVYPVPTDEVLKGRVPLYFALIQIVGGLLDDSGAVAGVRVALDRINNDTSLLPGYTLHYTLGNSGVLATIIYQLLSSAVYHGCSHN